MVDGYKSAMSTVRVSCRSTELKQCFRGFGSYGPLWFVAKKMLDSVCWFSHRRRTGGQHSCISYLLTRAKDDSPNIHRTQAPENTPGSHEMGPSAAAARCLLQAHTIRTQAGGVGSAKRVFVPGYVDIRTLARFCTVHLTSKFHHPTFNRSEVIMLTNKQTNKLAGWFFRPDCAPSSDRPQFRMPPTFDRCTPQRCRFNQYMYIPPTVVLLQQCHCRNRHRGKLQNLSPPSVLVESSGIFL